MVDTGRQDRFELRGELGTGSTGAVYRVFDRLRGREVALKALRAQGPNALWRFKREFRELADLAHPNLVGLHELYVVGDEWMFTMELVDGVRFRDWVAGSQPRLRDALIQLADALTALHALGKLHRDVKPSNVLVEPDGRVVILDFGLVGDTEHVDVTHQGVALGTPGYMSPEQAADITPLTAATDWYAVGVILYEALCGRKPFRGQSMQVLMDKQRIDPKPPSAYAVDPVPPDLEALCMRMLSRDPRARPDGVAVLAALEAAPSPWTRRIADREPAERIAGDRTTELRALHDALAQTAEGPVLLMLHGPRGAGRTALCEAFVAEAEREGAVAFVVRVRQREDVPLRALDQLIDHLTRYLAALPEAEATALLPRDLGGLARMFPTMKRLRAAQRPELPGGATELDIDRVFEAVGEMIDAISLRHPVVVILDDVHWGTLPGAHATARLFNRNKAHMLLVASFDDEHASDPVIEALRVVAGVSDLPLQARLPSTQR